MKYEANVGPPQGDHPTDRAINAMPLPQYSIAPSVAAGSVYKDRIDDLLVELSVAAVDVSRGGHPDIHSDAVLELINAIDALGAKHREAQQEENNGIMRDWAKRVVDAEERAEKAEAERDTLKESLRLVNVDHGLWMTRTHAAEDARDDALARVKELEADAMRWRYLRDLDHDLTGTAGQPCVALPKGMNSGYYLTGPEAIYAVDMSMVEAAQK